MAKRVDLVRKEEMRLDYITSNIDQRTLADKYGVTLQTVSSYATKDGWLEQREQYFSEIESKAIEIIQENQLKTITDRTQEHLKMWELIGNKLKVLILQASKPQDLHQLASVLDKLQKNERTALGLDQMNDTDDSQLNDLIAAIEASKPEGDE